MVLAPFIVVPIIEYWGWRAMFIVLGFVILGYYYWNHKNRDSIMATVQKSIDAGKDFTPEMLAQLGAAVNPKMRDLRRGVVFLALGVAMAYLHERPLWQRLVLLIGTIPIAIAGNVVYFGSGDGHLYALSLETGEELWSKSTAARYQGLWFSWKDVFVIALDVES